MTEEEAEIIGASMAAKVAVVMIEHARGDAKKLSAMVGGALLTMKKTLEVAADPLYPEWSKKQEESRMVGGGNAVV